MGSVTVAPGLWNTGSMVVHELWNTGSLVVNGLWNTGSLVVAPRSLEHQLAGCTRALEHQLAVCGPRGSGTPAGWLCTGSGTPTRWLWPLGLWNTSSVVVVHRLCCSMMSKVFPDQGSNSFMSSTSAGGLFTPEPTGKFLDSILIGVMASYSFMARIIRIIVENDHLKI